MSEEKRNEAERRNLTDWTECVFIVLTTIKNTAQTTATESL
jgi:hypothetical protein